MNLPAKWQLNGGLRDDGRYKRHFKAGRHSMLNFVEYLGNDFRLSSWISVLLKIVSWISKERGSVFHPICFFGCFQAPASFEVAFPSSHMLSLHPGEMWPSRTVGLCHVLHPFPWWQGSCSVYFQLKKIEKFDFISHCISSILLP